MLPMVGDCLVLEEIDDHPAVGDVHIHEGMIGQLDHLPPEKLLLFGGDVKEVAIWANRRGIGGRDVPDEHQGREGTKPIKNRGAATPPPTAPAPLPPREDSSTESMLIKVV